MEDLKTREGRGEMDTVGVGTDIDNIHIKSIHLALSHHSVAIEPDKNYRYDWLPLSFLNLILQSAFIPNTKTLSTLLISHAGLGKTIKLDFLRQFDFVKYTLDVTPKHIADFLDNANIGKYRFLVIPDYIATLGHSKRTVDLARSIFRAMIEEGVTDIDIFGMSRHYDKKVKAGLISGITPEYFKENTRIWQNDGFLQRFMPFSYSHTPKTTDKVLDNIHNKIDTIGSYKMKVNKTPEEPIINDSMDDKIKLIAYSVIDHREPPYRKYIQITGLCMASAVLRDSKEVQQLDIDLVKELAGFMNRKENPL